MKKIAIVLAPAILMLGACGTESSENVVSETPVASGSTMSDKEISEKAFVRVLRNNGIGSGSTDSDLIELGYLTCDSIGIDGIEATTITLLEGTPSADDAGTVLGASIAAFCPEYNSDLERMIGEMV